MEFIRRATVGFEEYAASVEPFTLAEGERLTGVPAEAIRELAHTYARADRAIICWTLGITEHHNAVDNVLALINQALLTGHVGRYGSGLNPLRGQNNVQGGGDMGAIPNKLPGLPGHRERRGRAREVRGAPGVRRSAAKYGWHLTQMFEAMERGELNSLYVIGENPARSEADVQRDAQAAQRPRLPDRAGHLPDRDRQARRRRAARVGLVGRVQRHGHELRAPGAARAQGARAARRCPRRQLDHHPARQAAGLRLGRPHVRGRLGGAADAEPDARRHELEAPGRERPACSGRAADER